MSKMEWEALPQRKPRKRLLSSSNNDTEPIKSTTEEDTQQSIGHQSHAIKAAASIEANIAARSKVNRSQTTLESQDGCAGEFWECKSHF